MSLDYLKEPSAATEILASALSRGTVSLVLGAGVSSGMNLPGWGDLVTRVESLADVDVGASDASSEELMRRMDTARRSLGEENFLDAVHAALYDPPGYLSLGTYPEALLESRMLIAIGALVMSSMRGSVTDVYTLNFDDVLDWYLHLHGFRTQIVTNLPTLFSGNVDVRIHHFHGFLPLNRTYYQRSDWLVLSRTQLVERLAEPTSSPWSATMGSQFLSKMMLFVGSSMSDMDIDVILQRTAKLVDGDRPLGFVLGANIPADRQAALREASVVPISLPTYEDIPRFILGVCQRAALLP
jgi:hypothetical protein